MGGLLCPNQIFVESCASEDLFGIVGSTCGGFVHLHESFLSHDSLYLFNRNRQFKRLHETLSFIIGKLWLHNLLETEECKDCLPGLM